MLRAVPNRATFPRPVHRDPSSLPPAGNPSQTPATWFGRRHLDQLGLGRDADRAPALPADSGGQPEPSQPDHQHRQHQELPGGQPAQRRQSRVGRRLRGPPTASRSRTASTGSSTSSPPTAKAAVCAAETWRTCSSATASRSWCPPPSPPRRPTSRRWTSASPASESSPVSRSVEAPRTLGVAALTLALVTVLLPVPAARADPGPVRTIVAPVLDITFADADLKREARVEGTPQGHRHPRCHRALRQGQRQDPCRSGPSID